MCRRGETIRSQGRRQGVGTKLRVVGTKLRVIGTKLRVVAALAAASRLWPPPAASGRSATVGPSPGPGPGPGHVHYFGLIHYVVNSEQRNRV